MDGRDDNEMIVGDEKEIPLWQAIFIIVGLLVTLMIIGGAVIIQVY